MAAAPAPSPPAKRRARPGPAGVPAAGRSWRASWQRPVPSGVCPALGSSQPFAAPPPLLFPWVNLFLHFSAQDPSHLREMVTSASLFHHDPVNKPCCKVICGQPLSWKNLSKTKFLGLLSWFLRCAARSVTPSCIDLVITTSPNTSQSLPYSKTV